MTPGFELPIVSPSTCSVGGCNTLVYNRGFCRKHYEVNRHDENKGKCSVDGCDTRRHSRGMCRKHYQDDLASNGPRCRKPQTPTIDVTAFLLQAACSREMWRQMHELVKEDPSRFTEESLKLILDEGKKTRQSGQVLYQHIQRKLLKDPTNVQFDPPSDSDQ